MKFLIQIFLTFSLLLSFSVKSSENSSNAVKALKERAIEKQLWQEKQWFNLVHYYERTLGLSSYYSHVDDFNFFLAPDGATNPKSELLATLEAFYRTDSNNNSHPQCRFIARLQWLSEKLPIDAKTLPKVNCSEFTEWYAAIQAKTVTLIFPTYHLNSPSSMFGHTLLRLDRSDESEPSEWLSFAVNFGATVKPEDNSLFYAFKGLTGAYPGVFSVSPYFKKIQEYNRIEKRDIWEYQLGLTPEEVNRMVLHLWELREIRFAYYFFDENCAYRLLELIEVAKPELELTETFRLTAIPIDTVNVIEQAGLIKKAKYRPSQVTIMQAQLDSLASSEERELVEQVAIDPAFVNETKFKLLPRAKQRKIVDVAYRYLRYQQIGKKRNKNTSRHSYRLLEFLNQYPADSRLYSIKPPTSPIYGHKPRRIMLGIKQRNDLWYSELAGRMALHSLEDVIHGFVPGAQINMANLHIRYQNQTGDLQLERLDVVDIFSASPRTRFFKPLSWRVLTGIERQYLEEQDKLVAHVNGGVGYTYPIIKNISLYALGTARMERAVRKRHYFVEPALGIATGVISNGRYSTARLEGTVDQFLNGELRASIEYAHNFVVNSDNAIKIQFSWEGSTENRIFTGVLAYQYFF